MEKPSPPPSLKRIIWTDYPSFYALVLSVVLWIVYAAWTPDWRGSGSMIRPDMAPFFLYANIGVTLVSLAIIIRRILILRRVFRDGAQVRGRISSVVMRRDKGRVEYAYFYEQKEYVTGVDIHRNRQTLALKAGERVTLLVDPIKPARAFIRDLYV